MIFGGLEIVAGGYLIHRHYKKKNELEKQKLEVEAQQRRNNTFPGANGVKPNGWNTQAHHRPQYHHHQQQQQSPVLPPQKYACYAPAASPRPQYQYQAQIQPPQQPRPQPTHTQSFNIPRRPVPERKPEIIIQPSLQRSDSFATISRMPIANGSRPQDVPEEESPILPTRRHATGLQPVPQHSIYGNAGFSVSTPAFGATPTSPPLTYTMAMGHDVGGRQTVDDNWETYGHVDGMSHYAPTESTQLGERDPPPPYTP